jgi:bacillithiol biosynthesis cysteine-adding enzyme BshC
MDGLPDSLDFRQLGSYKPLYLDYISRFSAVSSFFAADPRDPAAWAGVADRVSARPHPFERLSSVLARQNRDLGADARALESIELLSRGALAVVTGQQVGLFGGPLYTLYKALTAVEVARRTRERLGRPVVPLFWMDADDHDFDEVRRVRILNRDHDVQLLSYETETPTAQTPVGAHRLESSVEALIETLAESLPDSEFKADALARLASCYHAGATLAEAFGRFLLQVSAGLGLAVVNPSDPELKSLAAPLFEREVLERSESGRRVRETTEALVSRGYHAQATAAAGFLNLFYASPARFHIDTRDGNFEVAAGRPALPAEELIRLLRAEPGSFSPNVLLRPLYQDTILPTLAYVAGPNELAYFAQLGGVYRHFDVPMPLIVPRASFSVVEKAQARFLERYRLQIAELRVDDEAALNRILREQSPPELERDLERARSCVSEIMQALARDLGAVDPTLTDTVRSTQGKVLHLIGELESRALRALKRKDETLRRQFLSARTALFPEFELQERQLTTLQYLCRYGPYFVEKIRESIDPERPAHGLVYF